MVLAKLAQAQLESREQRPQMMPLNIYSLSLFLQQIHQGITYAV